MKHRKLLIGTSIGCAILLTGAVLYVGCAASMKKPSANVVTANLYIELPPIIE